MLTVRIVFSETTCERASGATAASSHCRCPKTVKRWLPAGGGPLSLGRSMGPSAYSCLAMDAPRGPQRPGLTTGSGGAGLRAGQGGAGQPSPGEQEAGRQGEARAQAGPLHTRGSVPLTLGFF
jgi:hypothetical protein